MTTTTRTVTADELRWVPTPGQTHTWTPLSHSSVLEATRSMLDDHGWSVESEDHTLTHGGQRYFGRLRILYGANDVQKDYRMMVGLRNSHDKSISAHFLLGDHTRVCSNGQWFAEYQTRRVHRGNAYPQFREQIGNLIRRVLPALTEKRDEFTEKCRNKVLGEAGVSIMRCALFDRAGITGAQFREISDRFNARREGRAVSADNLSYGQTLWGFHNDATEVLRDYHDRTPDATAQRTMGVARVTAGMLNVTRDNPRFVMPEFALN